MSNDQTDDWLTAAADVLGVPPLDAEEIELLLDLTRDIAHGTERRFAPLTSLLVGAAISGRRDRKDALREAVDELRDLLADDEH